MIERINNKRSDKPITYLYRQPPKACKFCKEKEPKHYPFQCRDNPKNQKALVRSVKPLKHVIKPCKYCASTRHYATFCPKKPKKHIGTGEVWKRWTACKAEWFKLYDSDTYPCHYCGESMTRDEVTLDHKIPRSRAPELRYDFDNLVPCCWMCNGLKGTSPHDEYKHMCYN